MSTTKKVWVLLDSISKIQSQPMQQEQLQITILKMHERDWSRYYIWATGWKNWQILKDFLHSDQKEFSVPSDNSTPENIKAHLKEQISKQNHSKQPENENQNDVTVTKTSPLISKDKVATTVLDTDDHHNAESSNQKDFNVSQLESDASQNKPPATLNFKEINEAFKNRAERHELKIEILLASPKGNTFKSYSKNISLSGSLLEDNIPFAFYGIQFDLVVVNRNPSNIKDSRVQVRAETVGEGLTQRIRFINVTELQKQRLSNLLADYITQQKQIKRSS